MSRHIVRPERHAMCFRVLVYKEDGEYVAHALEADLLGHGKTEDEALNELAEALTCQITFALQKNDPSLILKDAPQEVFRAWGNALAHGTFRDAQEQHRGRQGLKETAPTWATPKAEYLGYSASDLRALRSHKMELACG